MTPPGSARGGPATWPIRRKLVALVALPTAVVIGLIGALVAQSYLTWRQAERTDVAADALISANNVITASDLELQQSLAVLLGAENAQAELDTRRQATDAAVTSLGETLSVTPDGGWTAQTASRVGGVATIQEGLPDLRDLVIDPEVKQATVAQGFDVVFQPARDLTTALSTELGARTPNPRTADATAVLSAVAATAQRASVEIVLVTNALKENQTTLPKVNQIEEAASGQIALLELAASRADAGQRDQIAKIRAQDDQLSAARGNAINIARNGNGTPSPQAEQDALTFATQAGERLDLLDQLVASTSQDLESQTSGDARAALLRLIFLSGLGLVSLIVITLLVSSLSRTITAPMRRLRSGAVDAATVRLPAAVRQIERDGPEAVVDVPPVLPSDAKVGPETREVAQALDGLSGEAIRLATSQVRLRQSLDEAFVAMSRRSQAMVEKQLAIIDELESTEEDAEQLRNLFRLDHLAARMRRYNDNLLVLAGSAVRTRSAAPVAVADVFRAATSEMEQYERVRLQPLAGASVAGAAAGGLIHLIAELLDNAAMYSPPTSPIVLAAGYTEDGGLRLEVTDSGVGIPPTEMAELNARLAAPGAIDTQVPSRMGLYVVARLAQRGGFGVRLTPRSQAAGTVAEVRVPKTLVLGAPTGPLRAIPDTPPASLEQPRLPSQHGVGSGGTSRPVMPMSPERSQELPTVRPAHPAQPAVSGTSDTGASSGLPSRRPGAALAGNPLGAQNLEQSTEQTDKPAAPTRSDADRSSAVPAAADTSSPPDGAPPVSPFGIAPPWAADAPQGGPGPAETGPEQPGALPRRTPGTTHHGPTPFSTRPTSDSPEQGVTFEPAQSASSDEAAEAGTTDGTRPGLPSAVPGHRPGARPLPVRAPGQPGGGPPIGPSAAIAVAASAAARPRPAASASGLFAATGPSLETGAVTAKREQDGGPDHEEAGRPAEEQAPQDRVGEVPPSEPSAPAAARSSDADRPKAQATSFEAEAREAAAARYQPADPDAPMIGSAPGRPDRAHTPIFDSISVWFSDDSTATAHRPAEPAQVIDLRDPGLAQAGAAGRAGSGPAGDAEGSGAPGVGRWASLGDQRWIAANARASSAPQTAGSTTTGLPRRRPGANLLPSATAAAGAPTVAASPPARRTDAESVRGRLGSYQRGLSSARRARHLPNDGDSRGLFDANTESGSSSGRQGGDS